MIVHAYMLALLVAGMLCLAFLLVRSHRWQGMPSQDIRPWRIGWSDIGLLFSLIVLIAYAVGPVAAGLTEKFLEPDAAQRWRGPIEAVILQAGMVAVFLAFLAASPFERRLILDSERMGGGAAVGKGLVFFLAFTPIRFALENAWMWVITLLGRLGVEIPSEAQGVAGYFGDGSDAAVFTVMFVMAVGVAPVVEELLFRAGLYRFLKGRMGRPGAILASSLFFALIHFNVMAFPTLALLGVFLCISYESSGNIRVPMVFHALFNLNSVILITLQGAG
jgi:hypothetical protein